MLIGMLGVLKAGGAYVPVDPGYPAERKQYIIKDTGAKVILTSSSYQEILQNELEHISIDYEYLDSAAYKENIAGYTGTNPAIAINPSNLAYVIYTSGTTGNPKGVMIAHRGIVNLSVYQGKLFDLAEPGDNVNVKNCLWYSNYVFDAHVWDVYTALTHGHRLYLIDNQYRTDLTLLKEYIIKHNIQLATLPPALLTRENILPLKTLVVAGDITNPDVMKVYNDSGVNVINAYGPTETTVCATCYRYKTNSHNTNIGKPISNTVTYVLDKYVDHLPIGAIGELYVGGAGVARGYLNQPEITAGHFIVNPFQTETQKEKNIYSHLYKTGDLVRYGANGDIEYIGRNDFQVKIRGYRIEPGEIEAKICTYKGIKQAVVSVKHNAVIDSKYLLGYYMSDSIIDETDLSNYLGDLLPDYMVPAAYIHLKEIPLTVNGKIDTQALPAPGPTNKGEKNAAKNDLETKLCNIYAEELGIDADAINLSDDFFKLGGNSMVAIKLVSRINLELANNLSVAGILEEILSHKTITQLSAYLSSSSSPSETLHISAEPVTEREAQLLSFAQERLWFIENYAGGSGAYNIPIVLRLKPQVDTGSLTRAIVAIFQRHEILRTVIKDGEDGIGYQQVADAGLYPLKIEEETFDNMTAMEDSLEGSMNKAFDLSSEYPIAVKLYNINEKDASRYISIVIHHIAFDGWSTEILIKEMLKYYKTFEEIRINGDKRVGFKVPALALQYKEYALWQRNYLKGDILDNQLTYWKDKLLNYEMLQLATDKPRPANIDYEGADTRFKIDKQTSNSLRELSKQLGVSLYSLLLSGLYLLLHGYTGQDDIVIGVPVSNRHHGQLADLIGFFVNSLALRVQLPPEILLSAFIQHVGKNGR